jgi:hypothetical protein
MHRAVAHAGHTRMDSLSEKRRVTFLSGNCGQRLQRPWLTKLKKNFVLRGDQDGGFLPDKMQAAVRDCWSVQRNPAEGHRSSAGKFVVF